MTSRRPLLPFLTLVIAALGLCACQTPRDTAADGPAERPAASYIYNPVTHGYEWRQDDRRVTGAYQP